MQQVIGTQSSVLPARRNHLILLLFIIVLGTLLRINQLGLKSFWIDEIGVAWHAQLGPLAAIKGAMTHIAAAPLDYVVTSLAASLDKSDFALRLPSVIWGVLAIYFIDRIGTTVLKVPAIGLCAAFLLAVLPTHIEYSQEVRFYSLFTLLSLVSFLMFARALQHDTWLSWLGFTIVLSLTALTHYYTVFLIFVFGVFSLFVALGTYIDNLALFRLKSGAHFLIPFAVSAACASAAIISWYLISGGGHTSNFTFKFPVLVSIFATPLTGEHYPNKLIGYIIFPTFALIGFGLGLVRRQPWVIVLMLCPVVAMIGTLALDSLFSYFYSLRQVLFAMPFYILLVSAGLVYSANALLRCQNCAHGAVSTAAIIIAVLLFPQIQAYYSSPKTNWRDTALFLRGALIQHNSALVINPTSVGMYLFYYQPILEQHLLRSATLNSLPNRDSSVQRIWLLSSVKPAVPVPEGWQKIEVTTTLGSYRLYYLGNVATDTLWREVSQMDLPLSLAAQSDILDKLVRNQPKVANQSARNLLQQLDANPSSIVKNEICLLLTKIGRALFDSGDQELGLQYVERASNYGLPDQREVVNALGYIYLRQKRCGDVISVLVSSARLTENYWGNAFLGDAYRCQSQWIEAARAYHKAFIIRMNPDMLLSEAQMYIEGGAIDQATPLLKQLSDGFPGTPAAAKAENLLNGAAIP